MENFFVLLFFWDIRPSIMGETGTTIFLQKKCNASLNSDCDFIG